MAELMRCQYCGLLQDEPEGVKECQRCGGELGYEQPPPPDHSGAYLKVQMELDQVSAPAERTVDRHLLVTLRTPIEVPPEQAAFTESGRPPLSLNAVLDVSGSMRGDKMAQTKEALRHALRFLREEDTLSLAVFSEKVRNVFKPKAVDRKFREKFESGLEKVRAGGTTALCGGLEKGIGNAAQAENDNNLVLLLSDGQANVGETDIEKIGMRSSEARKRGVVVSTLGVGQDYNEALMAEVAVQGGGRYYHVHSSEQIVRYLTGELGEAVDLAARDVRICINIPKGAALIPLSAAYEVEISDGQAVVSIGDIPRDLEVEIPLRLTLFANAPGSRLSVEGEVQYLSPAGNRLANALNRVTVRFVSPDAFNLRDGVAAPVVERVAKQMRAAQVLKVSRAAARHAVEEMDQADRERVRLRDYLALLGDDTAEDMLSELDEDLHAVRMASPKAKYVTAAAFRSQRFMRDLDKD
jgi:Ca-activated chloride channel family protein